jgi:hypothetical protein
LTADPDDRHAHCARFHHGKQRLEEFTSRALDTKWSREYAALANDDLRRQLDSRRAGGQRGEGADAGGYERRRDDPVAPPSRD